MDRPYSNWLMGNLKEKGGDAVESHTGLSSTHFKQMRKELASIERAWNVGELGGVKEHLQDLNELSHEVKETIKNQLYVRLKTPYVHSRTPKTSLPDTNTKTKMPKTSSPKTEE